MVGKFGKNAIIREVIGHPQAGSDPASAKAFPDGPSHDLALFGMANTGVRDVVVNTRDRDAGRVVFKDGTTMPFSKIDHLIPCFTPGTMIATPRGEVLVESLKVGDRVLTRDNGIKTINWVGSKRLDYIALKKIPELRPIMIKAGALGENVPDRDMLVSPMHRLLVVSHIAQLHFNQSEVLVPAKYLLAVDGVQLADSAYVTYVHFMCETHEIVLADGVWSESFQPGDYSLKGLDNDQREEVFALFPLLSTQEGVKAYRAARPTLNKQEAALIFKKK